MTPKIQKKMDALQAKMQKKYPDYEINYVYDKKGKVYALSYNENKQQFVSLQNMKPVSQDKEFFDVNDQPFSFDTGPDLYEVLDKDGNQAVLAFDNDSNQFFNPETGEPVDIENYTDVDGNPIDPSQFATEQPADDVAENNEQQEDAENYDEANANQIEDQQYQEQPVPEQIEGLEYANPNADQNPNEKVEPNGLETPNQESELYQSQPEQNYEQPQNPQANNFVNNPNQAVNDYEPQVSYNQNLNYQSYPQDVNQNQQFQQQQPIDYNQQQIQQSQNQPVNNQPQELFNYNSQPSQQIPNLAVGYQQPQPQESFQENSYQPVNPQQNSYQNQQLNDFNNFQNQQVSENQSSMQNGLNNSQQQYPQANYQPISNLNNETNVFEPKKEEPVVLNYQAVQQPSSIPTTEVASSVDVTQTTPIINTNYQPQNFQVPNIQPSFNTNVQQNLTPSFNSDDNVIYPKLETVSDSSIEVKLDPVVTSKPTISKPEFSVIEEPANLDSNNFSVSEELATSELFNKKTKEIVEAPIIEPDVHVSKSIEKTFTSTPVLDESELIPEPKIFITPEVRMQPQAIYTAANKQENLKPASNNYATSVNLKDYKLNEEEKVSNNANVQQEHLSPASVCKEAPLNFASNKINNDESDYIESDLQDFRVSKPVVDDRFSNPNHDVYEYPEYEPRVEDYEYDPDYQDYQEESYRNQPYSISRDYRNYETAKNSPNYGEYDYLKKSNYERPQGYIAKDYMPRSFSQYPLTSFRPSIKPQYLSLLDSDRSSFRPSRRYPTSRSLTVLIDDNYLPTIPQIGSNRFRSYQSRNNYHRPSYYGNSYYSSRSLSSYGPYQMRTFRNWQPTSLTSSINTYSMPLPSSYGSYRSTTRPRSYRTFR